MVESVSDDAKRKRLDLGDRFVASRSVGHGAGNLNDFGDPTTVGFLLDFDPKRHRALRLNLTP
jgi:hypothetical protein